VYIYKINESYCIKKTGKVKGKTKIDIGWLFNIIIYIIHNNIVNMIDANKINLTLEKDIALPEKGWIKISDTLDNILSIEDPERVFEVQEDIKKIEINMFFTLRALITEYEKLKLDDNIGKKEIVEFSSHVEDCLGFWTKLSEWTIIVAEWTIAQDIQKIMRKVRTHEKLSVTQTSLDLEQLRYYLNSIERFLRMFNTILEAALLNFNKNWEYEEHRHSSWSLKDWQEWKQKSYPFKHKKITTSLVKYMDNNYKERLFKLITWSIGHLSKDLHRELLATDIYDNIDNLVAE